MRLRLARVSEWIDTHAWQSFLALTAVYILIVTVLSSMKLLWLDELITLHIARLGSFSAIWSALAQGADPNPPMTHLLVMFCRRLFGEREIVLRLPAIIGYWTGILSLFLLLKRRVSPTWALAGVVMSMTMGAFEYSYESRSYGIFYGLAMLAVLCWSITVDPMTRPTPRRAALAGMALALAGGVSTNYFAVLAFLPIAGGELARTFHAIKQNRRSPISLPIWSNAIDLRVWIAMTIAGTPLLAFRPLIRQSIALFSPHPWNRVSLDQVADSYTEMVEIILYLLLALMVFAGIVIAMSRLCPSCRAALRPRWLGRLASIQTHRVNRAILPIYEAVAVFLLMAYPILGYCIASLRGGMLSPRFVIPVCFGFAIAGTVTCIRIFGHMREAAAIVLLVCTAWFVTRESTIGYWYSEQKQCFYKVLATMPSGHSSEPIVVPDPLMVLTLQRYASPSLTQRIVFPVDFPAVRLARGEDSPEENLWAGRGLYDLPIMPFADFQRSAGRYLIIANDGNWLVQDLLRHRYPVERLPINTRAGAIGGFTPLFHGTPIFYTSAGDRFFSQTGFRPQPIPFKSEGNQPSAKLAPSTWGPFEDK